ncbi:MAG: hypothetical protein J6O73_18385 [Lachnospiraceae bacterium]|nr:hypothetical protein [Lachnospiraceae bacterium]MBO6208875.1 hypothetical protein [Lachnospiraceae bacterium]
MKESLKKTLPVLVVGILFMIYVLLWYKQFSYFHYSGESFALDDAGLQNKAAGAKEAIVTPGSDFPERLGRIVFWPTKYSEITVENGGTEPVALVITDYEGRGDVSFQEPQVISADDAYAWVADGRDSYVLTVYSAPGAEAGNIRIHYDNHGYMGRWKKCIYAVLGSMAVVTFFSALGLALQKKTERKTLSWIAFGAAVLCGGVAGFAHHIRLEDTWLYAGACFLSVFLSAIAIVCAAKKEEYSEETVQKAKPVVHTVFSALLAMAVHFLFLSAGSDSVFWRFTGTLDSNRRILGYLIVVIVFLLAFLILEHCKFTGTLVKHMLCCFRERVAVCAGICTIVVLCDRYNDHRVLSFLFLAGILLATMKIKAIRISNPFWPVYYAALVVLIAANHCVINLWSTGRTADVYHTGTLYHSLYYVANGLPFPGGLRQMYGHFALFYKIPLLLFGNNMRTVGCTTAVFAGIAALCLLLFLHRSLKEDLSRLIAGLLVLNCFIINQLYLQTFPLRMLWPFVLLLYSSFVGEKGITVTKKIIGYLLCALAIVWNMESGLVCTVSWAVVAAVSANAKESEHSGLPDLLLRVLKEIPFVVLEILTAYMIVKGYNMLLTAPGERMAEFLDWKKEMSTMAREEAGDTSNGKLFWSNAPWIAIELFLLCNAARRVHLLVTQKKLCPGNDAGRLFLTVFAIGIMIYWMGRPEEYDSMAPYVGALLVLAYEGVVALGAGSPEQGSGAKEQNGDVVRRYAYMIALAALSLGMAGYLGHTAEKLVYTRQNLAEKSIADYGAVRNALQAFDAAVPEDTYVEAYGIGVIYMSLGRELTNDGLGWGNGTADLEDKVRDRRWVLLNGSNEADIPFLKKEKEIRFGTTVYTLYRNDSGE